MDGTIRRPVLTARGDKPEIILGPPGCGKTTSLLDIVDHELSIGTLPEEIAYVSFTRRAATEAAERAAKKFELRDNQLRWFRTLHSFCFQSLGLSTGDVFERSKILEFSDWIKVKLTGAVSMEDGGTFGFQPGDRAMFMENLSRVRGLPSVRTQFNENDDGLSWVFVERLARGLRQYKRDAHLVDYTDMLSMFLAAPVIPDIGVLIVDEVQDLSWLQWQVVIRLAARARRVAMAGDDDQAIYKWAGADVDYFVNMEGHVRVLGQSWRVPQLVQNVSSDIIARVGHRREKEWRPRPEAGEVSRIRRLWEVNLWEDDILILARNAAVLRNMVVPLMREEGVLFEWRGATSVKPSTLAAISNWETLRRGEPITVEEARRVYELMSSGVGVARGHKTLPGWGADDPVTMRDLQQAGGLLVESIWHDALDKIPTEERVYMLRARQKGESFRRSPRVRLSTIHGAKGGQAKHVVVMRDMASRTYREMAGSPDDEARVWYVAVTRAMEKLSIVAPATNMFYDV